jgi:ufm1-conjugating enzyme 1
MQLYTLQRNAPHFGIAHALAMGLAPWLATEVPHLVSQGILTEPDHSAGAAS